MHAQLDHQTEMGHLGEHIYVLSEGEKNFSTIIIHTVFACVFFCVFFLCIILNIFEIRFLF